MPCAVANVITHAIEVAGTDPKTSRSDPATLRGPLRKPQQSGFGLWVGNLPTGTDILTLKDQFSSAATKIIESVLLISKSKCAFVNYLTDVARLDSMSRY